MHFKVSAVLPLDARAFLVERDSAAFRALVAKTQKLGALEIEDGWRDGNVQVPSLSLFLLAPVWCDTITSVTLSGALGCAVTCDAPTLSLHATSITVGKRPHPVG